MGDMYKGTIGDASGCTPMLTILEKYLAAIWNELGKEGKDSSSPKGLSLPLRDIYRIYQNLTYRRQPIVCPSGFDAHYALRLLEEYGWVEIWESPGLVYWKSDRTFSLLDRVRNRRRVAQTYPKPELII